MTQNAPSLFDWNIVGPAIGDSFKKLDPRLQWRNPVMFVVYVGSAFTTALAIAHPAAFGAAVAVWLWFTVLFANFRSYFPSRQVKPRKGGNPTTLD